MNSRSMVASICLCCLLGCSKGGSTNKEPAPTSKASWDSIPSMMLGPFRVYEKTEDFGGGMEHKLYLGGKNIAPPKLFYTHYRALDIILSNTEKYLLLNDSPATKANIVVLVNLDSWRQKNVGEVALKAYRNKRNLDPRLWILPEGKSFSPDDRCVLVEIVLHYISTSEAASANELAMQFEKSWYLIDAENASVVAELTEAPPWSNDARRD